MRRLMLIALLTCGCGDGSQQRGAVKDLQLEEYGKAEVRKLLRDPNSASFEFVRISRRAGAPAVCGYVNSKNGFGGMSGRQRFISGGATVLEEQMSPGDIEEAWQRLC